MTMTKAQNPAILQFEIDTRRFAETKAGGSFIGMYDETPWGRIYNIAKTAVCDTIKNGGTFALVAGDGKITMVQRTDAEEL